MELREHMFYQTKEISCILLLVEDISLKLKKMQQVNYFAYKKKENLIDIVSKGLVIYTKRKKKSAVLLNKDRHFRPQLISFLQVSLVH